MRPRRSTVAVDCHGAAHRLVITVDGDDARVELADHDPAADAVFEALGGQPSPCAGIAGTLAALAPVEPDLLRRCDWLRAGVTHPRQVESWRGSGFTPSRAARWLAVGVDGPELVADWQRHGFRSFAAVSEWTNAGIDDPRAAAGWRGAGPTVADAARWWQAGVRTAQQAGWWAQLGVESTEVAQWRDAGVSDGLLRPLVTCGVRTLEEVKEFFAAGVADGEDLRWWTEAGVRRPADIAPWNAAGVGAGKEAFTWTAGGIRDPVDIEAWRQVGVLSARHQCSWYAAGVRSPVEITAWRAAGIELAEIARDFALLGARPGETLDAWRAAGVTTWGEARRWLRLGVGTLGELEPWRARGIDSPTATAWLDATGARRRDEIFAWMDATGYDLRKAKRLIREGAVPEAVVAARPPARAVVSENGRPDVEVGHRRPRPNGAAVTSANFYAYGRRSSPSDATHAAVVDLTAGGDVIPGSDSLVPTSGLSRRLRA